MDVPSQVLVIARLASSRDTNRQFSPKDIEAIYFQTALPLPSKISNVIDSLRRRGFVTQGKDRGDWQITPLGRQTSVELMSDIDLVALAAESNISSSVLGQITHTVILPPLAPPTLVPGLQKFLREHPFERNVFGMTRFPDSEVRGGEADPVKPVLEIAREVCRLHGLEFHLASDRAIHDDLWMNTAAHMWASQYGIGFFEDRRGRGLNYNLTIEVGGMLITGRRCALLKDSSIAKLPTDLVGHIYKSVDLSDPKSVGAALHEWIQKDLGLGSCPFC